jgi:hypothetical protein
MDTEQKGPIGHGDTISALRAWGHHGLADDLARVVMVHDADHSDALAHYQGLVDEMNGGAE